MISRKNMTNENKHTVLCVDDEQNILNSLKRLLRREGYTLLTASSGRKGLEILRENDVHLVLSDQRMPEMNGTDFLAKVKKNHPDTIRIILTGYTEVDAITESINRGNIYKFFLKPWNDENLKLEIAKALEQYDLIQTNKRLRETIIKQNEKLRQINETLEKKVKKRTQELEIKNQALELSRAVLEDLPFPIIGISSENIIALTNQKAQFLFQNDNKIILGESLSDYFSEKCVDTVSKIFQDNKARQINNFQISEQLYLMDILPLSNQFRGKGIIMALTRK